MWVLRSISPAPGSRASATANSWCSPSRTWVASTTTCVRPAIPSFAKHLRHVVPPGRGSGSELDGSLRQHWKPLRFLGGDDVVRWPRRVLTRFRMEVPFKGWDETGGRHPCLWSSSEIFFRSRNPDDRPDGRVAGATPSPGNVMLMSSCSCPDNPSRGYGPDSPLLISREMHHMARPVSHWSPRR